MREKCEVLALLAAPACTSPEYQLFLGGIGQENVQKMFSFSDMLLTKHWKQILKKPFRKKRKLTPKNFAPNFVGNDWA